jgi:hypothetical protein
MGASDSISIRELAQNLKEAAGRLRALMVKKDFSSGELTPMRDQCEVLFLVLDNIYEASIGNIDDADIETIAPDLAVIVRATADRVLDLEGELRQLMEISEQLDSNPEVADWALLKEQWVVRRAKLFPTMSTCVHQLTAFIKVAEGPSSTIKVTEGLTPTEQPPSDQNQDKAAGDDGSPGAVA